MMSGNFTAFIDSTGFHAFDPPIWRAVKFWLLLFAECVSIPCYLFVIYHFLADRTSRLAIHNHVTIVTLIINFLILTIDVSFQVSFLRLKQVIPSTPAHCLIWQYIDYGVWFGDVHLTLWASIERHILIFHSHLFHTVHGRWLNHYIPMVLSTLYAPTVYFYLVVFYPVSYDCDYTLIVCGGPYYYDHIATWFIWWESVVHYVAPICLIIIITIALILRVTVQKCRLHQATNWRRYRRMTLQLISMSVVYVFDVPYACVTIVRWSGIPNFAMDIQAPYLYYLDYITCILIPFAIVRTLPNFHQKIRSLRFWKKISQ